MANVAAVVLAAGKSERMGQPKALLNFHGRSFLQHICAEIAASQLTECVVVLGHQAKMIQNRAAGVPARFEFNRQYEQGQLSSLLCGLKSLPLSSLDGAMLFLVDHPEVNRQLIDSLLTRFSQKRCALVIPVFGGRKGHPVIFGARTFGDLLAAPPEQGAVFVVRKYRDETEYLEVQEPGVLVDVDTPEDYRSLLAAQSTEETTKP
ncbi:MAG: nucleotidyltransferase family protein [Acidobacteriota bacterium]